MRTENTRTSTRPTSQLLRRGGAVSGLKRVLTCLLVALFCMVPVSQASALDKNQIVQMAKLGLESGAIKGAIDGAGSELKLSAEDVGELRAAGVDEEIIEYLEATGHLESDAVADEPAAEPGAEGDDETGDSAGPVPVGEEQGERLSEEELEKRVQERADKLDAERRAQADRQRNIDAEARKLPGAARALEDGNRMAAARAYLDFLALEPEPGSDHWYEAQFGLARALYGEGILSGAARPLLEVIQAGADRPHFTRAFYMLEELTKQIGFQPPTLEEMTSFYINDMNEDFQNDFNYYLGKFFFDYGRNDLAIEYLSKVKPGSEDYPESLYVMGIAQLGQQSQMGEALKNFERAIVAGENEPGGNKEILQLGYLALARVFYEVGYYDVALYYYQKIPTNTARTATAVFESAWTYFVKNDYKRALGVFQTLHSPYYEQWYFPDLYILESAVYLNICDFDKSKQALAKFQADFLDKQPRLDAFLEKTSEPADYWSAIMGMYGDTQSAASRNLPEMFARPVLADLGFHRIYGVIQTLRAERDALKANMNSLGDFGQTVLDEVEAQLDTKIQEGGILVQQKLNDVSQELSDWDIKATQISIDIESEEEEQLRAKMMQEDQPTEAVEQGTTLLVVADDFTPWPFEGEYWRDEVTNYRSQLRSQCSE